jgi:hypothetical protein
MKKKEIKNTIDYVNGFIKDIPTRITIIAILEHLLEKEMIE